MDVRLVPDQPVSDSTDFAYLDDVAFVNAERHGEAIIGLVAEIDRLQEAMLLLAAAVAPVLPESAAAIREFVHGGQK